MCTLQAVLGDVGRDRVAVLADRAHRLQPDLADRGVREQRGGVGERQQRLERRGEQPPQLRCHRCGGAALLFYLGDDLRKQAIYQYNADSGPSGLRDFMPSDGHRVQIYRLILYCCCID